MQAGIIDKRFLSMGSRFVAALLLTFSMSVNAMNENEKSSGHSKSKQPEFKISSYDWNGEIPESRMVVVKNPYGSIRSRNHLDEKVFLHSAIQMIGKQALSPKFIHEVRGDKLFIEVTYDEKVTDANGQLRGRADVSVLFPDTVSIYAETDHGMIKIDKTASHVEARTKSGKIKLKTTGLIRAYSESGEIYLGMRGAKEFGRSVAESKSGKIKADVYNDMEVGIVAFSKGKVTLNGKDQKNGRVYTKGKDALELELHSNTGSVEINIVAPPALVTSVKPSKKSTPTKVDVDLRELPKSKLWKPGDPIYDRDDKRNNKKDEKS